jgi:hypothetical protein
MRDIIKLRNPILVNGEQVKEITVNTEEITGQLYAEADTRRRIAAGTKNVAIIPAVEFDFGLHLYIGFAAAIAANSKYTFEDLERIKGADLISFSEVGRNFLLKSEDVASSNSDERSETTPDTTTQAQQTLSENE